MTTGSWSTLVETSVATSCSGNTVLRNGSEVSWSGTDSVKRYRTPSEWAERQVVFVLNPNHVPYKGGRFLVSIDPARIASMLDSKRDGIFDAARSTRLRLAGEVPDGEGDYGQPHRFQKRWSTWGCSSWPAKFGTGQYAYVGVGALGCGGQYAEKPDPWTPEDDYKLVSRIRAKVAGTDFNLASFLGAEGHDTLSFLGDTANRIYRAQAHARKGNFKAASAVLRSWGRVSTSDWSEARRRRQLDVYRDIIRSGSQRGMKMPLGVKPVPGWETIVAGMYLEYHLAIEPLLGDAVAAAEQLAHLTQMPREKKVRASVKAKAGAWGLPPYPSSLGVWAKNEKVVRKGVIAYFKHTPEPLNFLGLADPEVTIWNAIPMTFVSDYFYDIGGFLEARATARALPEGTYVVTTKASVVMQGYLRTLSASGLTTMEVVNYADARNELRSFGDISREIRSDLAVPPPKLVPLGALKSWQRAATISALIVSAASGEIRTRWTR